MGDAEKGEKEFKKCKACHMVQSPEGEDIVKGGKTGPNLYGVVGRKAGTEEGFKYSDALIKLGEAGEVWTPEDLEHYITDPNSYVQEKTGDDSLKTKMTFKLNKNQADVVAFLAKHSPDAGNAAADAPADAAGRRGGDSPQPTDRRWRVCAVDDIAPEVQASGAFSCAGLPAHCRVAKRGVQQGLNPSTAPVGTRIF